MWITVPCQGKTIYVLYQNVVFYIEDFWESFGLNMAAIHRAWPVCVFGTAKNQETGSAIDRSGGWFCSIYTTEYFGKKYR